MPLAAIYGSQEDQEVCSEMKQLRVPVSRALALFLALLLAGVLRLKSNVREPIARGGWRPVDPDT